MYSKADLLKTFNSKSGLNLRSTRHVESALKHIYDLGANYVREKNEPIYKHSIILYSALESASELYIQKNRTTYGYNTRLISVLISLYVINFYWKNTQMGNFSELASFGVLKRFTHLPAYKLQSRLNKLVSLGLVNKRKGDLYKFIVKSNYKDVNFYTLTATGREEAQKYAKQFYKVYLELRNDDHFKEVLRYNYSIQYLENLKVMFNTNRKDFNYEAPKNQALELIVKDFKTRFTKG
jgi:hypothetical protein